MSLPYRDTVAALFKAQPGIWLDGLTIAQVGGAYASRTRISECRTQLGMRIENRVRTLSNGSRRSEYRYLAPSQPQAQSLFRDQGGVGV